MHVAERGSLRHYARGRGVAREWWELVRGKDSLAIIARVESAAGSGKPLVVTLRTDTTFIPRQLEVSDDEGATVTVLGARTRLGTGSTARTVQTPAGFFVLSESPAVAPWGGLLRRWERSSRPARFAIPGQSDVRLTVMGRDSVLMGTAASLSSASRLLAPIGAVENSGRIPRGTSSPRRWEVWYVRRCEGWEAAIPLAHLGPARCAASRRKRPTT